MSRPFVIVSNRGPVSYVEDSSGELVARRGAGGLVSGLAPVVSGPDAMWIAAAISDADRKAATRGVLEADGIRARLLAIDPETYRLAYDVVSNETLWFLHHGLFDLPRAPSFGREFRDAWAAYRQMNAAFADAVLESAPNGAVVLAQDYHLALMGRDIAEVRPDLAIVHFSHTPFATPDWMRVLPSHVGEELLSGLCSFNACGFHTQRWADEFLSSCRSLLGLAPRTFVSPLPIDADDVRATIASEACDTALADISRQVGDRLVIGRSDRIELSKNIGRGFLAFDELLETRPEFRGRVVFVASVYPSRGGVAEYQRYQAEVEAIVEQVNARWGQPDWQPIIYNTADDYPWSVALLRRADVFLLNPLRDGLNLVAKEGALANERDAVLCLSTEAGAWSELGEVALPVDPFDIAATASTLATALQMPAAERKSHAEALRSLALRRRPADWLADQLAAASASTLE